MDMKKIGKKINLLMGLTMSIGLSIVGNIAGGGQRPVPAIIIGILVSFVASFIISMIIGTLVPMKTVGDKVCAAAKTNNSSFKGKALTSLVSDLIYTPIITLAMVALARVMAGKNDPKALEHMPPFIIMFLSSLAICFIVGWVLIFIFQPLYMKMVLKKNGIEM